MGLLSNGNITLVDLTDNRSVTLYLTTSLSKTQIETGNAKFEPDYSIGDGQVITPSLYFGQDLYNKDFNVKYLINNDEIENSDTLYVENNILYIKENLNKSSFFITAIIEETIEDPATKTEYKNIQAQLELTRLYNAEENYLPLINYERDTFTHDNSEGITLTAILYKGGSEFNGDISYTWSSSTNKGFSSTDQSIEILRDQIDNIATFTCIMKVGENSYSTSVTLRDWTDPLSSQIISNKGIYLQNTDDEIELTCKIFRKNTEVDANNYIWKYYNDDDKENSPITISGANEKTLSINFNNLPITGKTSILFECEAQVKKAGTTDQYENTTAQTTIAISPAYRIEIEPRNIFIQCDEDGNIKSEEENFIKEITFKLLDLNDNILKRVGNDGIGSISKFIEYVTIEAKEGLWDYTIKLEIPKIEIKEDDYLINIPYTYFGFQDSDEFYLIKSIQGITGESAIDKYIISPTSIIIKSVINNNGDAEIEYSTDKIEFKAYSRQGNLPEEEIPVNWKYKVDGGDEKSVDGSSKTLTLEIGTISPNSLVEVQAYQNGKLIDSEKIEVISENRIFTTTLSNDTISIPFIIDENKELVADCSTAEISIVSYYGENIIEEISYNITPESSDNLKYSINGNILSIEDWSGESASTKLTISAKYAGQTSTKTLTLIKIESSRREISTIENEYHLNNNPSEAPAKDSPNWKSIFESPTTENKYLWKREKITYTVGDNSYTNAAIISTYVEDARYSYITSSANTVNYFFDINQNKYIYSPSSITIRALSSTGHAEPEEKQVYWRYNVDNAESWKDMGVGDNVLTSSSLSLSLSDIKPTSLIQIEAYVKSGDVETVIDSESIEILTDDKQLTVSFSDDLVSIPTDASGKYPTEIIEDEEKNKIYSVNFSVYYGIEDITSSENVIINIDSNNVVAKIKDKNSVEISDLPADVGSFTLTAEYAGQSIEKTCQVVKIKSGRGITKIEEYYCKSSSNITAPEIGWILNEVPSLSVDEQYLWNYEEITYDDGSNPETTPPCVIGNYQTVENRYIRGSANIIRKKAIDNNNLVPENITFNAYKTIGESAPELTEVYWKVNNEEFKLNEEWEPLNTIVLDTSDYSALEEKEIKIDAYIKNDTENEVLIGSDTIVIIVEEQPLTISFEDDLISIPTKSDGTYAEGQVFSTSFNIYYGETLLNLDLDDTDIISLSYDSNKIECDFIKEEGKNTNKIQITKLKQDEGSFTLSVTYGTTFISKTCRVIKVRGGASVEIKSIEYAILSEKVDFSSNKLEWNSDFPSSENLVKGIYLYTRTIFNDGSIIYNITAWGEDGENGENAIERMIKSSTNIIRKKIDENGKTIYSPEEIAFSMIEINGAETNKVPAQWKAALDNETNFVISGTSQKDKDFSINLKGKTINDYLFIKASINNKEIDSERIEILTEEQNLIISLTNDNIVIPYTEDKEGNLNYDTDNAFTSFNIYYGLEKVNPTNIIAKKVIKNAQGELEEEIIDVPNDKKFLISDVDAATIEQIIIQATFAGKTVEKICKISRVLNGINGTSVTIGSIEYLVSDTQINPSSVTEGWSTTYPPLTKGKYLYTRTTFSNGSKIYTESYQGTDGADGEDAVTFYTWLKYADSPTSGMSDNPEGKKYIGISYNNYSINESTNYDDYTWSLIRGENGTDGVNGVDGKDGKTYYTWVKYADDDKGTNMTNDPTGKFYIGLAYNKETPNESNTTSDYTWSLFRGADGVDGKDGVTYYTWIKYADSPTSGMSDNPEGKKYIGLAYNKISAPESTLYDDYSWSLIKGEDGSDGINGIDGKDGKTYYTWVKYADDASGANMSNDPTGKFYIGLAYNKEISTESNMASDYTWSLFRGSNGVDGKDGNNGRDAVYNYLLSPVNVISKEGSNYSQDLITFSAFSSVGTETNEKEVYWEIFVDGDQKELDSNIGTIQTLYLNKISPESNINVKIYEVNENNKGDFIDEETVEILSNEKNLIISLTNDNIVIPQEYIGGVLKPNISNANTTYTVYYGLEDVTLQAEVMVNNIESEQQKIQIEENSIPDSIEIKAFYKGITTTKICNITLINEGKDGNSGTPTVYSYISSPANIIIRNKNNSNSEASFVYSPNSITFTAYEKEGNKEAESIEVWWKSSFSDNPPNGNSSFFSKTYSPTIYNDTNDNSYINIWAYSDSECKNLIDSERVEIISDEKQLTISATNDTIVIPHYWSSNGHYPEYSDAKTDLYFYYGSTKINDWDLNSDKYIDIERTNGSDASGLVDLSIKQEDGKNDSVTIQIKNVVISDTNLLVKFNYAGQTAVKQIAVKHIYEGADGSPGEPGRGITKIENLYKKSSSNTDPDIDKNEDGMNKFQWSSNINNFSLDETYKYLWNKEHITYTSGDSEDTSPAVISVYTIDGRGISSIKEYYYATATKEEKLPTKNDADEVGEWETSPPELSATNKYLWNYEKIIYTDKNYITTDPAIIGVFGEDGAGIFEQQIAYAVSENGVTAPENGWSPSIPSNYTRPIFLWTRITTTYTDGRDSQVSYSVSYLSKDGAPGEKIISIVPEYCLSESNNNENKPNDSDNWSLQVPDDFIDNNGNVLHLWCRYKMKYEDESVEYSDPELAENIKDLNITMADAKLLIDNKSIQLVAAEANYEDGDLEKIKTASLSVLAGQILFETEKGKYSSYMSFEPEGLTIGSENNDYYSQILNGDIENNIEAGFYIKYKQKEQISNGSVILETKEAGIFSKSGLRTNSLTLNMGSSGIIMLRTSAGGVSFGQMGGI